MIIYLAFCKKYNLSVYTIQRSLFKDHEKIITLFLKQRSSHFHNEIFCLIKNYLCYACNTNKRIIRFYN